jgi:S-adenosyl-L-methionine hydrolase (adenosine-forming)
LRFLGCVDCVQRTAERFSNLYAKYSGLLAENTMICLVSDFGPSDLYTGQVKAALHRDAPGVAIIDLLADAPTFDPRATAYLLAPLCDAFAPGTIFLCVVDPGVGGNRVPCVVLADDRWFVGPANGIFEVVIRRARKRVRCWQIDWRPSQLSASFHGRDLFAPVAARLARGEPPPGRVLSAADMRMLEWPDDLPEIVYIDGYGNAISGLRAAVVPRTARIVCGEPDNRPLAYARTFSEAPVGSAFWYENANGLVEISINQGRAGKRLGLAVGSPLIVDC